ncbi:MAG TPA: hypothetical protein VHX44_06655, partial [Planctomycetota bacterium]|nr:hypothetical protein [Planctomycetota bacterium]
MLTIERAFIGFNHDGVVAVRNHASGELTSADCPASMLPRVRSSVTLAGMRAWAAALSGAQTPIRGACGDPPPASRVLSSVPQPWEVQHQRIKTRDFTGKYGSQVALVPTVIPQ